MTRKSKLTDDEQRQKAMIEGLAATRLRKAQEQAAAVAAKRKLIWELAKAKRYADARNVRTRAASRVAKTGVPKADPRRGQPKAPLKLVPTSQRPARGGTIGLNGISAQQWQRERYEHWLKTSRWCHPTDDKYSREYSRGRKKKAPVGSADD